jgi:undecaprenyl-diphosphatase
MRRPVSFFSLMVPALLWLAMLLLGGAGWVADAEVLNLLYAGGSPRLADAATVVTEFGGWKLLLPITALAVIWLLLRKRPSDALLLVGISIGGRLLVEFQKYFIGRIRPEAMDQLVPVHSLSFPSGHAANSMIVYLAIALLLFAGRAAVGAAICFSLLIGLSRILLGVHWPSDVLGGWAFGLFWTLAWLRLAEQAGTPHASAALNRQKEQIMANDSKRRPDDGEIIDEMEDGPGQSGASGGNLQRDVASRAEEDRELGGTGVTRVHKSDKPADGDMPNLPNR